MQQKANRKKTTNNKQKDDSLIDKLAEEEKKKKSQEGRSAAIWARPAEEGPCIGWGGSALRWLAVEPSNRRAHVREALISIESPAAGRSLVGAGVVFPSASSSLCSCPSPPSPLSHAHVCLCSIPCFSPPLLQPSRWQLVRTTEDARKRSVAVGDTDDFCVVIGGTINSLVQRFRKAGVTRPLLGDHLCSTHQLREFMLTVNKPPAVLAA